MSDDLIARVRDLAVYHRTGAEPKSMSADWADDIEALVARVEAAVERCEHPSSNPYPRQTLAIVRAILTGEREP